MKYGFVLPVGDARTAADFAYDAEQAGWDGFFVWETVWGIDAWVSLTAAAMRTERIRLGTDLTPLSRMRPWKLASETATLDHLSNGRVILAVGLGAIDTGFAAFGEVTDRKTARRAAGRRAGHSDRAVARAAVQLRRQALQDQRDDILPAAAAGAAAAHPDLGGRRMAAHEVDAASAALRWHSAGCDGRAMASGAKPRPRIFARSKQYVEANRTETSPFDIVMEGETPGDDPEQAAAIIGKWADAGATWWIESRWELPRDADGLKLVRERILQGPPQLK